MNVITSSMDPPDDGYIDKLVSGEISPINEDEDFNVESIVVTETDNGIGGITILPDSSNTILSTTKKNMG
ncbi:MAG: hypothetical protein HFE76_05640 [Firmicutes bacterium]|nr:hypothetical protein [Bacillota bacterium]